MNYFECKISYEKQMEDGKTKKVSEVVSNRSNQLFRRLNQLCFISWHNGMQVKRRLKR